VAPVKRFELATRDTMTVLDGDVTDTSHLRKSLARVVDDKGRIVVLHYRYHVGNAYVGETVDVSLDKGLLSVHHHGVLIATHARRHLPEDAKFTDQPKAARPTLGTEVLRTVDNQGAVSFAGTAHRVGNHYKGRVAGVRIAGDTVQITLDGDLVRTHKARHDRSKEFGALTMPNGKPRRKSVA
jgi:hypothetical protein